MKVLISIGGWTYSSNFAQPASTEAGRRTFAKSAVQILKDCGFDGIDIDWEHPQDAAQAQHLVLLLKACREELDAYANELAAKANIPRPHFPLTVAAPMGAQNYSKLQLGAMNSIIDFFNLMSYDYAGSWDQIAGHQANLRPSPNNPSSTPFSTEVAIKYFLAAGIPSQKLILGIPLYGRAFLATKGPGTPYSGIGEGSYENGIWDYKALPKPGATEHFDEGAGASYSLDQSGMMVTYDTPHMVHMKNNYIHENHLGGAMFWETSGDKTGPDSLIDIVANNLGGGGYERLHQEQNLLVYPDSKYENLRKGFPEA